MISKEKVRKKAVETRDSIDEESRQQKSEEIAKKILEADWFKEADIVLSYHAFRSEVEVDTLNRAVLTQGKKLYLPKTYVKEKQIRFFEITDLSKLKRGYQKIWEPTGEEPEFSFETVKEEQKKVLMIMPGTAYDARMENDRFYDSFCRLFRTKNDFDPRGTL